MAGLLRVNENATFSCAGWAFDEIVGRLATRMTDYDSLSQNIARMSTEYMGYGDLRELADQEFELVVAAAKRALEDVEAEGAASFADPTFFPGFVEKFKEFIEMLESDVRRGTASKASP